MPARRHDACYAVVDLERLTSVATALLRARTPGDIAAVLESDSTQTALASPAAVQAIGSWGKAALERALADEAMLEITERSRATEALRATNQVLRGLTEGTSDAVFVKDENARYLMMNAAGARTFGMSVEEVVGKDDEALFLQRDAGVMRARDAAIMASRQTVTYESTSTTAAGEKRTWLSTKGPYFDQQGKVIGLIGVSRDITEQKRTEEAQRLLSEVSGILVSSLEDFESTLTDVVTLLASAFVDACAVHVVERSPSGQLRVIAKAGFASKTSGSSGLMASFPEELVETALASGRLLTTLDLDESARLALNACGLRSVAMVPVVLRERPFACVSFGSTEQDRLTSPLDRWLTQELGRRVGSALENNRLYRDAQRASRLKDEFLSVVSHELRTPLTAVLGWTNILRTVTVSQDVLTRGLASIERNALTQARLVEDLMDGTNIMAGKLRVELRVIEMFPLLDATVKALRSSVIPGQIRVVADLEPTGGAVRGDARRLQQIVENLVSNAIKFTPPGGTITIRTWLEDEMACLSVEDDGEGITPDLLPHIFDRFFQGDSSRTRKHGGLGLGLAIVRYLVEAHAGVAIAESAGAGRGATFLVKLPLTSAPGARVSQPR